MSETSPSALADQTDVGSYFVATYPPFSVWSQEAVARDAVPALQRPGDPAVPLGLYLHVPFCRKRCHFCYFRVYTDKNSQEVGQYLDLLAREWEFYGRMAAIAGRPLNFVYFGGGTPSFLSTQQLEGLVRRLTAVTPWNQAEEITFECEPGTLTEAKLAAIRRMGVTRLSLGVENFDDRILELNGRAHRSPEIGQVTARGRRSLINIDPIAGMLGETDENRAMRPEDVDLDADSVTICDGAAIQQISKDLLRHAIVRRAGRELVDKAPLGRRFSVLERAGYHVGSAYTAGRIRRGPDSVSTSRGRAPTWRGWRRPRPHQRRPCEPRHVGNLQRPSMVTFRSTARIARPTKSG
jgi:oxygen-independent coproporphyrinogen-3 oxidase